MMFQANQNDPNQRELDPNKALDGLGLIGWFRLVFQTRKATIRQCDAVVETLVRKMDEQEGELRSLRRSSAWAVDLHGVLCDYYLLAQKHVPNQVGSELEKKASAIMARGLEVL